MFSSLRHLVPLFEPCEMPSTLCMVRQCDHAPNLEMKFLDSAFLGVEIILYYTGVIDLIIDIYWEVQTIYRQNIGVICPWLSVFGLGPLCSDTECVLIGTVYHAFCKADTPLTARESKACWEQGAWGGMLERMRKAASHISSHTYTRFRHDFWFIYFYIH